METIIEIYRCKDCPFYSDVDCDGIDRGEESWCNYYGFPDYVFGPDLFILANGEMEKIFGNIDDDTLEVYEEFFAYLEKPLFCGVLKITIHEL